MDAVELTINVLGWVGTSLLVGAYALLTSGRLRAGAVFQVMNLFGGLFLMLNTAYYRAWPSTALNLIWFVIGSVGLVQLWRRTLRGSPA